MGEADPPVDKPLPLGAPASPQQRAEGPTDRARIIRPKRFADDPADIIFRVAWVGMVYAMKGRLLGLFIYMSGGTSGLDQQIRVKSRECKAGYWKVAALPALRARQFIRPRKQVARGLLSVHASPGVVPARSGHGQARQLQVRGSITIDQRLAPGLDPEQDCSGA